MRKGDSRSLDHIAHIDDSRTDVLFLSYVSLYAVNPIKHIPKGPTAQIIGFKGPRTIT